jgi:hypothetical protein
MATLWWEWDKYTLSDPNEDIGEVMRAIAGSLPGLGYTGVQVAEDVHGFKGDFLLAVIYLIHWWAGFLAGRRLRGFRTRRSTSRNPKGREHD